MVASNTAQQVLCFLIATRSCNAFIALPNRA